MDTHIIHIQGRDLAPNDIVQIQSLIQANPDWSRYRLSRELCRVWDWMTPSGQLKDMACRSMLVKLENKGLLQLPERRMSSPSRLPHRIPQVSCDTSPVHASLHDLRPLQVRLIHNGQDWDLFRSLLVEYHYLGFQRPVGESLRYLVYDRNDRLVAGLLFGSAAWRLASRDRFIGWTSEQRQKRLQWITNNTRFLIPPWVEVPHLASHVLGLITRRLSDDWQQRYGHPIVLLETFVGPQYAGTCYKAANWHYLGHTTGRGRNDLTNKQNRAQKAVFVYPLIRKFQEVLQP